MSLMEANDYRLERWLAILLSLLFFLPFVARADDIAFANASYHGDEMPYRDGEEFLALTPECVLVPVRIQVTRERDPIVDNDEEATGKRVELPGFDEYTVLLRGPRLHPGKVAVADPDFVDLELGVTRTEIHLGKSTSQVYYRCAERECSFVLETNGVSQDLITLEIARSGRQILSEVSHVINFAGDLDGDGRLDLIMNASTHYNETRPALFLSSAAKPGDLVGRAAELSMTGC